MRKVYQTKFGGQDAPDEEKGDCWQACVASILEIPLEEAWGSLDWAEGWHDRFNRWLRQFGLGCISFDRVGDQVMRVSALLGYHIAECKSTTLEHGETHVIVVRDGEVVHDPNPNATEIGEILGFHLFVALDVAATVREARVRA